MSLIQFTSSRLLKRVFTFFLMFIMGLSNAIGETQTNQMRENTVKVKFVFNDQTVFATLNDTPSANDFVAQLPLTVDLEDYASTEKIAYLPRKLTTEGAPAGTKSKVGDLSYYAPWGNMVIFYKPFGYASGLINLGHIDGDISRFVKGSSMKVTIELAE